MIERTFGNRKENTVYRERIGAYGIGFTDEGKIPIAMTHLYDGQEGYFLLGGGLEENEEHTECIIRESLEEAGLSVTPKDFVCKGDLYKTIKETQTDFHGIGYFYYMQINDVIAKPTEPDHSLVFLTIDEVREKLFLPHQIWAVEQVYKLFHS